MTTKKKLVSMKKMNKIQTIMQQSILVKTISFLVLSSFFILANCNKQKNNINQVKTALNKDIPADFLKKKMAVINTSLGIVRIKLNHAKAPITVKNFLIYVHNKHYDKTIFHRVIAGFMIQGGGFTKQMKKRSTLLGIKNEADNGLKNNRGTVAMARTGVVDSATNQFFVNLKDNAFLNFKDHSPQGYGYTVFASVVSGLEVIDEIAKVKTGKCGNHANCPEDAIVINSITVE